MLKTTINCFWLTKRAPLRNYFPTPTTARMHTHARTWVLWPGWETTNVMLRLQLKPKTLFELCLDAVGGNLAPEDAAKLSDAAEISHEVQEACVARARGIAAAKLLHSRQLERNVGNTLDDDDNEGDEDDMAGT